MQYIKLDIICNGASTINSNIPHEDNLRKHIDHPIGRKTTLERES